MLENDDPDYPRSPATVAELIAALSKYPSNMPVGIEDAGTDQILPLDLADDGLVEALCGGTKTLLLRSDYN